MGLVSDGPTKTFRCKCGRHIMITTQFKDSGYGDEYLSWIGAEDSKGHELEEIEEPETPMKIGTPMPKKRSRKPKWAGSVTR